jgi:GAF domain-containing protein
MPSQWLGVGANTDPLTRDERAEERAHELATEQAALRHVATLVARESAPDQLFAVVAEQVARIFDVPYVRLVRYEPDGSVVVGGSSEGDHKPFPIGSHWPLESPGVAATVRKTGRPARVEDYADTTGEIAAVVRGAGMHSGVASPIVVERRLWGAMVVLSPRPLPEDTEARLTDFAELVATAIANAESRIAIGRLADEHAALRRVATLVAEEAAQTQVFDTIADEAMQLLRTDAVRIVHYEGDGGIVLAGSGQPEVTPPGFRFPLDGDTVAARIFREGKPARQDEYNELGGSLAESVRAAGIRSVVGAPVLVEGRLWGAITTGMTREEPLPPGAESRLGEFTALMATAISNAEARAEVERLAEEQAALRRVATLVARGVPSAELFSAVSKEVEHVFSALEPSLLASVIRFDPGPESVLVGASRAYENEPVGARWTPKELYVSTRVLGTRRSARVDESELDSTGGPDADVLRLRGFLYQVGSPVVVEGQLWGAMCLNSRQKLPPDTEGRLEKFTELVATAIANAEAGDALALLAEEQAALRRVATLVAGGTRPERVFQAVAAEVGVLFGSDVGAIVRFEDDRTVTVLGDVGGPHIAGKRVSLDPGYAVDVVRETSRSARFDTDDPWATHMPSIVQVLGIRSAVASPILVQGELWGAITIASLDGPMPLGAERRLTGFTELVATAVANTQAREEFTLLADEQAALRRVATLVARGAPSAEVFDSVATEVGKLFSTDITIVGRYNGDGTATAIGNWSASGGGVPVGTRSAIGGHNVLSIVAETGEPARVDGYTEATGEAADIARRYGWRSSIAAPIVVEDGLWGVMLVATRRPQPFPSGAEQRLAAFTDLVSTAVANAQAQTALERVVAEQATLRRIATLVAEGLRPEEIFAAVIEEVGRLFGTELTIVGRFQDDPPAFVAAALGNGMQGIEKGSHWKLDDPLAATHVFGSGRSIRVNERLRERSAALAEMLARLDVVSTVASPVTVEGRLWGAVIVSSREELPGDTEERLEKFTELVATAIANAESKSALDASRRRIVAASDDTRRRIERDLHDGTQQRLVSLGLAVRAAEATVPPDRPDLQADLSQIAAGLAGAVEDLQELSRGIHPAILSRGGLVPALRTLARRSSIPVELDVSSDGSIPQPIEVAAYFVASEGLANASKHADASRIELSLARIEGGLLLAIRDDGVGGADPARGSGLLGLTDRVEALGGSLDIESRPGAGTQIAVRLPLELEPVGPEEPEATH